MDSNVKLFVWVCSLCLIYSNACGMFLDLSPTTADNVAAGDLLGEAMQELNHHLGGQQVGTGVTPKLQSHREGNTSPDPAAAAATTAAPSWYLLDDMNESLEQAADLLGDLWRQFSKQLLSQLEGGHEGDSGNTDADPITSSPQPQPQPQAQPQPQLQLQTPGSVLQRTKTSTTVRSTATSSVETATIATP